MKYPGDYASRQRGYIPPSWYQERLGLREQTGRGAALRSAMRFFLDAFLDPVSGNNPFVSLYAEKRTGKSSWEWGHTKLMHDSHLDRLDERTGAASKVYPKTLSQRLLLASVWRGDLAADVTDEAVLRGLLSYDIQWDIERALSKVDEEIIRRHYGIPEEDELQAKRFRFPRADRWLRIHTGFGKLKWFVVDLDRHSEKDEATFSAALRFLLIHPGLPRPGLIATSKSSGRHLFYFIVHFDEMNYGLIAIIP